MTGVPSGLFQIAGKSVLVTGGGGGLGRAISCGFANSGARVAVTDVNIQLASDTACFIRDQGGEAVAETLDVTSKADVDELIDSLDSRWAGLDVIINCAGRAIRGAAIEYKEADWDTIITVNLKGTFLCCQAAARKMAQRRRGKIINVASIGGFIAYPGSIAYLASKGGVVQLTRGFAVELAPYNVQVNAIAPSLFDTPMTVGTRSDPESQKYFMDRTPIGRKGQPEEVVGAAIFLASDCSSMVTGHVLAVDGGFLAA